MVAKLIRRVQLAVPIVAAMAVSLISVDLIVSPLMTWVFTLMGWRGRTPAICAVSSLSILYVYWFVRWFNRLIIEYEARGQNIAALQASKSRWDRLKANAIVRHQRAARRDNIWVMRAKLSGWPVAIVVGIMPEVFLPGARTVVVSFCATFEWRFGLVVFMLADIIKNIGWSTFLGKLFHA